MKSGSSFLRSGGIFILAGLLLFFIMTIAVLSANGAPLTLDDRIRFPVYALRSDVWTAFFILVTRLGNTQTIIGLCLVSLLFSLFLRPFGNGWRNSPGLSLAAAAIGSTLAYKIIKTAMLRPRPVVSLHLIAQGGYSFPSGHAMTSLVVYGLLAIWICRFFREKESGSAAVIFTVVPAALLIFGIGFSRIYLGVHYPSDVLAGWGFGTFLLTVFAAIFRPEKSLQNSSRVPPRLS